MILKIILIYYIIINIVTFLFMLFDKRRAILNKYRISEATLFKLSFLGGCIGFLLGMYAFRHKIRKAKFYVVAILSIILHGAIIYGLYYYL